MSITPTPLTPPVASTTPPRAARVAVSLMFFANGVLLASWASRIPTVQQHLALNPGALGIALWGLAVGALAAFPVTGWLITRLGSRKTTTLAACTCCVALVLPALAPNLPLLWLALALLGAGNSAMDVAMNAQGAEVEVRYGRPIMSSFHGLWSVGSIVGASCGGLMAGFNIAPLPHFLAIALLLGIVIPLASRYLLPIPTQAAEKTPIFARPTKALLGLGIIGFCSYLSEGAIADWSGVYLHTGLGTSLAIAAVGYTCYAIAMTLARLNGDRITQLLGPVRQVRISGLLAALGMGMALLIHQPVVAIIGFTLVGIGLACIAPLVFSTASRIPGIAPGLALAAVATMAYTGSLVGPPVLGQLADLLTLRGSLALLVLLGLLISLFAHTVRKPHSQTQQADLSGTP